MTRGRNWRVVALGTLLMPAALLSCCAGFIGNAHAQEADPSIAGKPSVGHAAPAGKGVGNGAASGVGVLETHSYWRVHVTIRPLVIAGGGKNPGAKKGDEKWLDGAPPPPEWMQPDFDDSEWWRDPGPFYHGHGRGPGMELALLCLRGKFEVTDPARVRDLSLSLSYRGGAVVYLNGQEVARGNMPAGKTDVNTLAEDYPDDAHGLNGYVIRKKGAKRIRSLEGAVVPSRLLRKGTNVLAVELHRAALTVKDVSGGCNDYNMSWASVGFAGLRLTAASDDGIVPWNGRPKGVQVWNSSPKEFVLDADFGTPVEKLRPVRIPAARNGAFSGVVVLSSDAVLKNVSVRVGDLKEKAKAGTIGSAAVSVRYALNNGRRSGSCPIPMPFPCNYDKYDGHRLGAETPGVPWVLAEKGPLDIPVPARARGTRGAVLPVWITVAVPKDASPGLYEGTISISANGGDMFDVPLEVNVSDWALPDPEDFKSFNDTIESPESLRYAYDVPKWSEEHFRLIGKSFDLIRGLGNRTVYIPVLTRSNFGNEDGMVKWIKKGDDYSCDFSIMEKYLDVAVAHMGKPRYVCLMVWDVNLGGKLFGDAGWPGGYARGPKPPTANDVQIKVSYLDPATGQITEGTGPAYCDPKAETFWKPFVEGVRERLKKRGLGNAAVLGPMGDCRPLKEQIQFWTKLMPEAPWICSGHHWLKTWFGAKVVYATFFKYESDFRKELQQEDATLSRLGWRDNLTVLSPYRIKTPSNPPGYFWSMYEDCLHNRMDGLGRVFADFFKVRMNPKSRWSGRLLGRFLETNWGTMNWGETWLAQRPEGPVATMGFEAIRSGVQEAEAVIFLQDAVLDRKAGLGEALAAKVQAVLDERRQRSRWVDCMGSQGRGGILPYGWYWYAGTGWPSMTDRLYATAAEAAGALGKK